MVHTNRIEGSWKHAKDHFRKMSGTSRSQFESHVAEVLWPNHSARRPGTLYEHFFDDVSRALNRILKTGVPEPSLPKSGSPTIQKNVASFKK